MKNGLIVTIIALSIILAGTIIGASVIFSANMLYDGIRTHATEVSKTSLNNLMELAKPPSPSKRPTERPKPGEKTVKGVTAGDNAIMGDDKAKVLLVEFSDFQCPFSKKFYGGTFPVIKREYINSGKVKFTYRDFPLNFHAQAKAAAIACECAGKQNKYWDMFDKLSTTDSFTDDALKGFAEDIGLNTKIFNSCLDKKETKTNVEKDMKDGQGYGVRGTPAFFVNGRYISGAAPFATFKTIIDEELAK